MNYINYILMKFKTFLKTFKIFGIVETNIENIILFISVAF